jgi:hypothetical protein
MRCLPPLYSEKGLDWMEAERLLEKQPAGPNSAADFKMIQVAFVSNGTSPRDGLEMELGIIRISSDAPLRLLRSQACAPSHKPSTFVAFKVIGSILRSMTLMFIDEKVRDLLVKEEKIATDCSFALFFSVSQVVSPSYCDLLC